MAANPASIALCLRCGSGLVDVRYWKNEATAVFRCSTCNHEADVVGFTIGRAIEVAPEVVEEARNDMAWPESFVLRKPVRRA